LTHRFAGEVTLLKSKLQFKPFIYLNLAALPAPHGKGKVRPFDGTRPDVARTPPGRGPAAVAGQAAMPWELGAPSAALMCRRPGTAKAS